VLPFRKIVFPVDYSEACQAVVPYAQDAVRHFSADITLVHAYGPGALGYLDLPINAPELALQMRTFEEKRLRDLAQSFPPERTECVVELGEPGTIIHEVVKQRGADLVMMPTHGSGPLRRMLLGSVTTKVLHDISAAVWTGSAGALAAHRPGGVPYKSVLAAVSEDEEASAVLVAAAALAKSYAADLRIVHVIDLPRTTFDIDFTPYLKDVKDAASGRLRDLTASLNIDAPQSLIEGSVPDGIHRAAADARADIIIVGRGHAQGTFSRMWSHLYAIVREAPCPVLSI
jgi:nucleotide-binding universal stress UspA family protein